MSYKIKMSGPAGSIQSTMQNLAAPKVNIDNIIYNGKSSAVQKNGAVRTEESFYPKATDTKFSGTIVNASDASANGGRGQDTLEMSVKDTIYGETLDASSNVTATKKLGDSTVSVKFTGPGLGEFGTSQELRAKWAQDLMFIVSYLTQGGSATINAPDGYVFNAALSTGSVIAESSFDNFLPKPPVVI